jgi:hypothetical protein
MFFELTYLMQKEEHMPFANKFILTMQFPKAGDEIGGFTVEESEVECAPRGNGQYSYPTRMILAGKGGQQGVRAALKKLVSKRRFTFSGYGNPYQLWFGKMTVESLPNNRYQVKIDGLGSRVFLERELERYLTYLLEKGFLSKKWSEDSGAKALTEYMEIYKAEARRKKRAPMFD